MNKANTLQKPTADETDNAATNEDSAVPQSYILLKTANADKLGKNSAGGIAYRVLADTDRKNLYITITGNDGGGYFSREIVPFSQVEKCLTDFADADKAFPSKLFKTAFVGRSSNNAGFLAAILRSEGLLAQAPDAETQHIRAGNWSAWLTAMFALLGEPFDIPSTSSRPDGSTESESHPESNADKSSKTLTLKRPKNSP
jgi:hypothetical protein